MNQDQFTILDCETTGVTAGDAPVEVALLRLATGERFQSLVNPLRPIPPTASAVHGLTDEDVSGAPTLAEIEPRMVAFVGTSVLVAHNAAFDRMFFPALQSHPWLCTLRLARHLWPDAPGHGNQVLRYWRKLRVDTEGLPPHRALSDAIVTAGVLRALIDAAGQTGQPTGAADLIHLAESLIRCTVLNFGKLHYGKALTDVPRSYMEWMLREVTDLDRDLRASIELHLRAA